MGTTADKLEYLDGTKSAIKQAIVGKGVAVPDGTTFRAYAEKIGSIVKVPSLSNPGSASDLRSGKQLAGADGSVITGTLAEVTQATPSIAVSAGGLITASATQSGGIVAAGSKSATKQLPTQAAKTVTPGTTNQTAVASGRYTTGAVTVKGDANLKAENIAEGVSIFGVQGAFAGGGIEQANVSISNYILGQTYITYLTSELQPYTATIGHEEKSYTCAKNTFIVVESSPDTLMDKYTINATGANLITKYSGSAGSEVFVFYINSNNCTLTATTNWG